MDQKLCPETNDQTKPEAEQKPKGFPLRSSSAVLATKHDPNFWANNDHVKLVLDPKARPFIDADMAVGQQIWLDNFARIDFGGAGTAGWTDPEGNDWEFDHDGNHNLIAARVMYEDDGMEGGDLDIDLLDQLSEAETKQAETLWVQYMAQHPDVKAATIELKDDDGRAYLITADSQGNILHIRRATGRPSINLEEQPAITQSQLYRETLASGHQDAQAQVVRNEIGLAIQILRNLLVALRSDAAEVSAAAEGKITTGDILNLYFHELLEYKGQLDSGKNTTEDQDRRAFFIMSVIAFYKTQYAYLQNPQQNQLPSNMRQLRRR